MGGKDAIVVDRETDVDSAVMGVVAFGFRLSGTEVFRLLAGHCRRDDLRRVPDQVEEQGGRRSTVGPSEEFENYMGPVINARAEEIILNYIETGKTEGRLIAGGRKRDGEGYFIQPDCHRRC